MPVKLENPATVAAPFGGYSHSAEVPAGARLIYIAGQVGVTPDGRTGETLAEQADIAYANIVSILAAKGSAPADIVKLTVYLVGDDPENAAPAARVRHLGTHRPASTAVFVSRLMRPEWRIEVEAVALAAG